jgi:lipoprotein-anchoring transpeptidase ErfK/SrfK
MANSILKQAVLASAILLAPVVLTGQASAQVLSYAPTQTFPSDDGLPPQMSQPVEGADSADMPDRLRRTIVAYDGREAAGTIVIDTANTHLYYVLGNGRAVRYGVGVGREGFTWSGTQTVTRKAEWPDWTPPAEMIARQPYLPRFMAGGPGNPLGARAMYLGSSIYRIHGTNDASTIGKFVSSGCIRLTNEDVADLFSRVNVGTKVVVLPKSGGQRIEARTARPQRQAAMPGRQAMNLSARSIY